MRVCELLFIIFAANLNKTAIKARNLLEGKENYSIENKKPLRYEQRK